jgi:amidophosphoribosyltransferase
VQIVRAAGASEIHMRITSPPVIAPCYYGIDIPTRHELIASMKSVEEICRFIGADSLGYLSLESVFRSVDDRKQYCSACFTDRYPPAVVVEEKQKSLFGGEEEGE